MINFRINVEELSLFYTIGLEVLRCDSELSVSRMCMVNPTYPNLALQIYFSSKVAGVIVEKRQLVPYVCNCGRISVWV